MGTYIKDISKKDSSMGLESFTGQMVTPIEDNLEKVNVRGLVN